MNTRLVWNFELTKTNLLNFNQLSDSHDELRWEARFFWPGDAVIFLNGLDEHFLALSNYKAKERRDCYLLLTDSNLNIKERRMQLFYKPLLAEKETLKGYGKKINLSEEFSETILPGTKGLKLTELLEQLKLNSQKIEIFKEALIYKLPTEPTIKFELARLEMDKKIYFSLCIEGHSHKLVASIAKQMVQSKPSRDYLSFIKEELKHVS